jgi:hypothetical protein
MVWIFIAIIIHIVTSVHPGINFSARIRGGDQAGGGSGYDGVNRKLPPVAVILAQLAQSRGMRRELIAKPPGEQARKRRSRRLRGLRSLRKVGLWFMKYFEIGAKEGQGSCSPVVFPPDNKVKMWGLLSACRTPRSIIPALAVIPARAGILLLQVVLDPGLRRCDGGEGLGYFCK